MKTKIVNLYGSPGCGKSTTAAGLYYKMKTQGYSVELVREYAKKFAYQNRKIKKTDQILFFNKQLNEERDLYGTVDYIITDSPIYLAGFYLEHNHKRTYLTDAINDYMYELRSQLNIYNFFINRNKPYDTHGRFETEEQAKIIDQKLELYLQDNKVDYLMVNDVDQVYNYITLYTGGLT